MGSPADPAAAPAVLTGILLDEMYPPALAERLRGKGHDVLAVLDLGVGLASRSDEDVLAWANRHRRCVVTENVSDFGRLASQGAAHRGLILVRAKRFPRTRHGLQRLGDGLHAVLISGGVPGTGGVIWLPE
ncbi:hypothetical protein GCM10010123_01390 [Pilimelia anulata]|uniref:DUF5615 domain-containing protein n=1 Tax=Pilimelia anulata TaxID=53371 RepID=A0A8J3B641_9ACTN|nr:DUF5615 family PIN-like protein [Pilimelia anulata]GGJ75149.1 hypothetical protein GCM10010123_01390 [Pilimelia anulata]